MATVIPKQPKKERDQITIRLDRDVLQTLEQYCRYLESGRDYVINQCLTFIFRKDKPFSLWLASQAIPRAPALHGSVVDQPPTKAENHKERPPRFRADFRSRNEGPHDSSDRPKPDASFDSFHRPVEPFPRT